MWPQLFGTTTMNATTVSWQIVWPYSRGTTVTVFPKSAPQIIMLHTGIGGSIHT